MAHHYGMTRIRLSVQRTHIDAVEYRAIIRGRHAPWQVGTAIQIARLGMVDIVLTPGNPYGQNIGPALPTTHAAA